MRYVDGWGRDDTQPSGQPEPVVTGADELDVVLDRIQRAGIPRMVDISPVDDDHDVPYGLQIGVGTTDRSFANIRRVQSLQAFQILGLEPFDDLVDQVTDLDFLDLGLRRHRSSDLSLREES
jgi:hypothetical protein